MRAKDLGAVVPELRFATDVKQFSKRSPLTERGTELTMYCTRDSRRRATR